MDKERSIDLDGEEERENCFRLCLDGFLACKPLLGEAFMPSLNGFIGKRNLYYLFLLNGMNNF